MDCFEICGGRPLHGEVQVGGAKNGALPLMAASLLARGKTVLRNVPRLSDIDTMIQLLRRLGCEVNWSGPRVLEVEAPDEGPTRAPYELVNAMRASICVLGPLLARRKRAQVAHPGGCVIGTRPIQLHVKGLKALGARVCVRHGDMIFRADQLYGNYVYLGGPSGSTVLGTANVLCAATLAQGVMVIDDAACEPEITELANLLNRMGARISGVGTKRLEIEGVDELHGAEFDVPPDRIEAGTYMAAAAITRGNVLVQGARRDHLGAVISAMEDMGISIVDERGGLRVYADARPRGVDLTTGTYPGLPTDMQAQMMALLSVAQGASIITERIFPDRFMHVMELNRMGANIRKEGSSAIIVGVRRLCGAPVKASDLRAGAALVIAGLGAKGVTHVSEIAHIDRGYERMAEKFQALGAQISRAPAG